MTNPISILACKSRNLLGGSSRSLSSVAALRIGPGPCKRVLGKGARQRLLAANLLATDETFNSDGDGTINVLGGTEFR